MQPVEATLRVVFAVLALLLFLLAGLGIPEPPRIRFVPWGLVFLTLAFFLFIRV